MSRTGFRTLSAATSFLAIFLVAAPASAQDDDGDSGKAPRRYRVALGGQLVPGFPGDEGVRFLPMFDLDLSRGDKPFEYEAPDDSFGISIFKSGGFEFGPVGNVQGERKVSDLDLPLDKVDTTFEVGASALYYLSESFRIRAEARRGLGGHDGWVADFAADYLLRDGDKYLFAIGPRATWSDDAYQQAYFGVTPAESVRTGLATYAPDGGLHSVGGTASLVYQLDKNWGFKTYVKYDRLIENGDRSPVVRAVGSRDQLAGGLALSYTWGG